MGQSKKISWDTTTRGSPTAKTTKRKDVWSTLLQISVWHALAEGRLHHRPHRAHHHRHRDHRQRCQVLTVRERGGLRGQRRLHRPHHQVRVFDAFFGILCSVLLFIGARMRHRCLLIFWILTTLACSIKYLFVFFVSDWTSLEDWVSISYLLFYTAVTLVVVAFTKECGANSGGVVHDYGAPPAYKA